MSGPTHRPALLVGAEILDAREDQLAADLADDEAGVTDATERMNTLLEEYARIPHPRPGT